MRPEEITMSACRRTSHNVARCCVAPVLTLAPDMRITTVTGWLADLDRELGRPPFTASSIAVDLRQHIYHFTAEALQETG